MPGKHHLRGFKIAKKIGSPLHGSDIKLAQKNRLAAMRLGDQNSNKKNRLAATRLGYQNSKKNRLAATRLVDDAPHRRWVKPPPPLGKKARSAPVYDSRKVLTLFVRVPWDLPTAYLRPSYDFCCRKVVVRHHYVQLTALSSRW